MQDAGYKMRDTFVHVHVLVHVHEMPDTGYRMPDAGYRMPDAGCRMVHASSARRTNVAAGKERSDETVDC